MMAISKRERRIVGQQVGNAKRQHMAVTVLMLQAFAGERGAAGGSAQQESAHPHVGRGPDQIANALEAEH